MLFRLLAVAALICMVTATALARSPVSKDDGKEFEPEVHVIGVYEGTYPPGIGHGPGFHPKGAVTVKVGDVQRPVILVLTSYEPVVWKIVAPKGAVIQVLASGYYQQTIEGMDEKVPVTLLSCVARDANYFFAYRMEAAANAPDREREETKRKWDRLAERVKELTKRDIKTFQGKYGGESFEVK